MCICIRYVCMHVFDIKTSCQFSNAANRSYKYHSFLLFDLVHMCPPSVCVHCSLTSLWLVDSSKLHPADTNPGRPSSPPTSEAPALLRCLLSHATGGRHGNGISSWRRMRSTNARGLTFGEVCCAPGPDRRREILL